MNTFIRMSMLALVTLLGLLLGALVVLEAASPAGVVAVGLIVLCPLVFFVGYIAGTEQPEETCECHHPPTTAPRPTTYPAPVGRHHQTLAA